MIQDVLKDDYWLKRLTTEDYHGQTPLFYGYVEPYGTLKLDMTQRLALTWSLPCNGRKQLRVTSQTQLSKNTAPGDSLRSNTPNYSVHQLTAVYVLPGIDQ